MCSGLKFLCVCVFFCFFRIDIIFLFLPYRLGELKMMAGRIFDMRDKLKSGLEKEGIICFIHCMYCYV